MSSGEAAPIAFAEAKAAERLRLLGDRFPDVERSFRAELAAIHPPAESQEAVIRFGLLEIARSIADRAYPAEEFAAHLREVSASAVAEHVATTSTPAQVAPSRSKLKRVVSRARAADSAQLRTNTLVAAYGLLLSEVSTQNRETWFGDWIRTTRAGASLAVDDLAPLVGLTAKFWRKLERFPLEAAKLTVGQFVGLLELFHQPVAVAAYQLRKGVVASLPRSTTTTMRHRRIHAKVAELIAGAEAEVARLGTRVDL